MTRVFTLLLASLALAACNRPGASAAAAATPNPGAPKVEFFVMSQCPYGVQVENGVKEALDTLGRDVDFRVDFIGATGPNDTFTSMHGPDEVQGDIVQLCAQKLAPGALNHFIACQNKNPKEVAKNWEGCATENGVPLDSLRACVGGADGKALLTESFNKATARGARGSPTMFVGGKPYNGRRGPKDFLRAICAEYPAGKAPTACASIPESPKVNVTIVTDKRCADCNADHLVGLVKSRIANPVLTMLDYGDEAGRAKFDEVHATVAPLVLFDDTLKADQEAAQGLGRYLRPAGAYQSLQVGAQFRPVCANEGGCALAECKDTLACRPEKPGTLELFVMSQCPYGVQALNAMQEVLGNFKGAVDFHVNYIGSGTAAGGFQSLHGPAEVDEDLRELCAIKHYGKDTKFMDYVLCRNKDIKGTDWQKCATGGIDPKVIATCVEGAEGKKLLEDSLALSTSLGIGASPSWIANGKYKFSALDPQSIKTNLCAHNPTLKGCDKTLSSSTNGTPQGGCGN